MAPRGSSSFVRPGSTVFTYGLSRIRFKPRTMRFLRITYDSSRDTKSGEERFLRFAISTLASWFLGTRFRFNHFDIFFLVVGRVTCFDKTPVGHPCNGGPKEHAGIKDLLAIRFAHHVVPRWQHTPMERNGAFAKRKGMRNLISQALNPYKREWKSGSGLYGLAAFILAVESYGLFTNTKGSFTLVTSINAHDLFSEENTSGNLRGFGVSTGENWAQDLVYETEFEHTGGWTYYRCLIISLESIVSFCHLGEEFPERGKVRACISSYPVTNFEKACQFKLCHLGLAGFVLEFCMFIVTMLLGCDISFKNLFLTTRYVSEEQGRAATSDERLPGVDELISDFVENNGREHVGLFIFPKNVGLDIIQKTMFDLKVIRGDFRITIDSSTLGRCFEQLHHSKIISHVTMGRIYWGFSRLDDSTEGGMNNDFGRVLTDFAGGKKESMGANRVLVLVLAGDDWVRVIHVWGCDRERL
ncbi:hypothetical protein Tco_0992876 [Tanacetum coccineum]|uniref:Uncharacterized protein n=1 Tax=Tanacetum coccineum TaxID=301880 RepID=A0ABQ5F546_9ASTR